MRKMIAYPLTAALLILGGCSKMDTPDKPESSCDLCHTTPLNKLAVHRLHLSYPAMAKFPYMDLSDSANYAVVSGGADTTVKLMVDPAFKFSNSATIDNAKHYEQTRLLSEGIQCADCHRGLDSHFARNNDPNHHNGKEDPSFNPALLDKHYNASDTNHYIANYLDTAKAMSFDGTTTCNNIVCHGAGRKNLRGVVWNPSPKLTDTLSCMGCHNTTNHKVGVACDKCHYDVTLDYGKTIHNFRKHLNDTINYGRY